MMGSRSLSEREKEVLELLSKGYSNKDIGESLSISPFTVGSHKRNMMMKLKVNNVAGLIRVGFKRGLLQ